MILRADEVDTLPDLKQLYRIVSLIGRHQQGLASAADVQVRADALLRQDEWLRMRCQDLRGVFSVRGTDDAYM